MPITQSSTESSNKPLDAAKENCEQVAQIQPGSTNEMGAQLQKMILNYYSDVRKQAQQSFYCALGAAIAGTMFFIYAAWQSMQVGNVSSIISLIAGGLIQVISAINFFLYGNTTRQFSSFHICLERTNRFLLTNTLCDNISCNVKKDVTRQLIIKKMLDAPMLSIDGMSREKNNIEKKLEEGAMVDKSDINVESLLS